MLSPFLHDVAYLNFIYIFYIELLNPILITIVIVQIYKFQYN